MGQKLAAPIDARAGGIDQAFDQLKLIDTLRVKLVYCNPEKGIGFGFCAGACSCGIWALRENDPIEKQRRALYPRAVLSGFGSAMFQGMLKSCIYP